MKKQKIIIVAIALCLPLMSVSYAAKLTFSWTDTMIKNCPTQVDVYLDTQGKEIGTAGVNIMLNKDEFTVNKFDTSEGVFRNYPAPKVLKARKGDFQWKNFLRLIGTTSSPNGFIWTGSFGTLTITPLGDKLTLEFYMIPWYDGEDSNLALRIDNNVKDILTEVENKTINVIEWDCPVKQLPEIKIIDTDTSVFAEDTKYIIEDNSDLNKENIFDVKQETNRFKKNINYIAISIAILVIVLVVLLSRKKKEKKKKNN